MKINVPSSIKAGSSFGMALMFWGLLSGGFLVYALLLMIHMTIAFFETGGMLKSPLVYEAIYIDLLTLDSTFLILFGTAIAAVFAIATLYSYSQYGYFKRLADAMSELAETGTVSRIPQLGVFSAPFLYFSNIIRRQISKEPGISDKEDLTLETLKQEGDKIWPSSPHSSVADQLQFSLVALCLGLLFAISSMTLFMKTNVRLVELYGTLINLKLTQGSSFMNSQAELMRAVAWVVFFMIVITFTSTGVWFGKKVAETTFAVTRDLRIFIEGDFKHRVFLRSGDPAQVYVIQMNLALDRIEGVMKHGIVNPPGPSTSGSNPFITPATQV